MMIKRILFWSFLSTSIFIIAGLIVIYQIIVTLQSPLIVGKDQASFTVEQGDTWDSVIERASAQQMLTPSWKVDVYIHLRNLSIGAGEYEVSSDMTVGDFLTRLDQGLRNRPEVTVTIPEGSDTYEVAKIMSESLGFTSEEFIKEVKRFDTKRYSFIESQALEGYLFPDTYRFFQTDMPEDVINKMLITFQKKAIPILQDRNGLSRYEILTLASIVEKEVQTPSDRQIVAGIFYNRLNDDMMLQSDATINYVTRGGRAQATLRDLEIDSPYNTYRIKGLPPTPITNPGLDSIKAVLNPKGTEYIYFLTTRDNPPITIFSKTYEEHLEAKAKYLD